MKKERRTLKIVKVPPARLHDYWGNRYFDEQGEEYDPSTLPLLLAGHLSYTIRPVRFDSSVWYRVSNKTRAWDRTLLPSIKHHAIPIEHMKVGATTNGLLSNVNRPASEYSTDILLPHYALDLLVESMASCGYGSTEVLGISDEIVDKASKWEELSSLDEMGALYSKIRLLLENKLDPKLDPKTNSILHFASFRLAQRLNKKTGEEIFADTLFSLFQSSGFKNKVMLTERGVRIDLDENNFVEISFNEICLNSFVQHKSPEAASRLSKVVE